MHAFDGWEDSTAPWAPATNGPGATEQSGSFVFAAQHVAGEPLPLIGGGVYGGIVFRPGVTRINCGKAKDSAGTCAVWHPDGTDVWCPTVSDDELPAEVDWGEPADTCGRAWRPQDFGAYLHRLTAWQQHWHRLWYNEIIIDAPHWRERLPDVIEAIFGNRELYDSFVSHYHLDEARFPLVSVDMSDWEQPFKAGGV